MVIGNYESHKECSRSLAHSCIISMLWYWKNTSRTFVPVDGRDERGLNPHPYYVHSEEVLKEFKK